MKKSIYSLLTFTALFICSALQAQTTIHIKIPNMNGESTVVGYEGSIEALAYSHSVTGCPVATGTSTGTTLCRPTFSPFSFQMNINPAAISLRTAQLTSKVITAVDVFFLKPSATGKSQLYYKMRLENVMVTQVSESGSDGGTPIFYIELNYTRIAFKYININQPTGEQPKAGWDITKNVSYTPPTSTGF